MDSIAKVRHRMPNPIPNPNPSYAGPSLWRAGTQYMQQ